MKTAIELIEEYVIDLKDNYNFSFYKFLEKIKELKETEKQQIIDAYSDGMEHGFNKFGADTESYYTSTFTTNKETLK